MILYIGEKILLHISNDEAIGIGFKDTKPTTKDWLEAKQNIEELLGHNIVDVDYSFNQHTKVFWVGIGNAKLYLGGNILEVLQ
jgi:hypothetical protein